jgi:hypothetical protein
VALLDKWLLRRTFGPNYRDEPRYVRTASHDGKKSVDLALFLRDSGVRRQLGLEAPFAGPPETNGSPQENGARQDQSQKQ